MAKRRNWRTYLTKTPCEGAQVKYRWPCTWPSFLPSEVSSSSPTHTPSAKCVWPINLKNSMGWGVRNKGRKIMKHLTRISSSSCQFWRYLYLNTPLIHRLPKTHLTTPSIPLGCVRTRRPMARESPSLPAMGGWSLDWLRAPPRGRGASPNIISKICCQMATNDAAHCWKVDKRVKPRQREVISERIVRRRQ